MLSLVHIFLPLAIAFLCAWPLGKYMARIYTGKRGWLHWGLSGVEALIYRICRIDPREEMHWRQYFMVLLLIAIAGFVLLFAILAGQAYLPLNPNQFSGLPADLAFNVAISFVTNTNWQAYGGESQLSYFSQAVGLVVQNFLSAATGMAAAAALFRGLKRKGMATIGNAWADIVRSILYILLPLSCLFALFLASQGVVQNTQSYVAYEPLQAVKESVPQLMAQGPVASQAAIALLGSNGGGYFNANAAHPFANPTPWSNFIGLVSIFLIPIAFVFCFGAMVGDRRQGWSLLTAMTLIFVSLAVVAIYWEEQGNPLEDTTLVDQSAGNMEGKEVRIGAIDSALWAVATTATSGGSTNSAHDSFMPLSGMAPLILIQFGELIYGGVGTGTIGILLYVLLTVFLGGLMVGRTPEYLGKKLGPYEIKMTSIAIFITPTLVLLGSALAISTEAGRAGLFNQGAQGFTEIVYALSSTSNNNGSAFAGLHANSPFYNILLGICMLLGRYWVLAPVLAIAGSLAQKEALPENAGTLLTHSPLFTMLLVWSIVLIDVLTYIPALALGPIAEHLNLFALVVP